MATLNDVLLKATDLNRSIDSLLRLSTQKEYDDLSGLEIDYKSSEQLFLLDELRTIVDKLADVKNKIDYLNHPIKYQSRIFKNENGKYETNKGDTFSCGRGIEVLVSDHCHEHPYWSSTRVEHDGEDYYLVGHCDVAMNGLTVRVRG